MEIMRRVLLYRFLHKLLVGLLLAALLAVNQYFYIVDNAIALSLCSLIGVQLLGNQLRFSARN
jgi:hypothetical protein